MDLILVLVKPVKINFGFKLDGLIIHHTDLHPNLLLIHLTDLSSNPLLVGFWKNTDNYESFEYRTIKYDLFLITHDDNLILSDNLFKDILENNIKLYKPIPQSRYGLSKHQFNTELVDNSLDWLFLDNGYSEYIPKAFTPRGSIPSHS